MNRVLITGMGHTGTNLILEIIRHDKTLSIFPADGHFTEDRKLQKKMSKNKLPEGYSTKLCIENVIMCQDLVDDFLEYYDAKIIFSLRNFTDTAMARRFAYRNLIDGSLEYNKSLFLKTVNMLNYLMENYSNRLYFVNMHALINNFEMFSEYIMCDILKTKYKANASKAYKNIRIPEKKKKYKSKLDQRQSNLVKYEKELFGTFWEEKENKEYLQEMDLFIKDMNCGNKAGTIIDILESRVWE